jgi:hypothetical protein
MIQTNWYLHAGERDRHAEREGDDAGPKRPLWRDLP